MAQIAETCPTLLEPPAPPASPAPAVVADRRVRVLGVEITDVAQARALELIDAMVHQGDGRTHSVFFVNAHTLNTATADPEYRAVLNSADYVFGDGTGVRWAARLRGIRLRDNVNGTDLVPALLNVAGGYRHFLLGADPTTVRRAALHAAETFAGSTLTGYHHGYLSSPNLTDRVIRQINESRPHLLLVGMGNPLQEQWIHAHRHELDVPVCLGVGGLFHYWSGDIDRAPLWLRRLGSEWLGLLCQQPHKAKRYLLGNPLFLARAVRDAWCNRGNRMPATG